MRKASLATLLTHRAEQVLAATQQADFFTALQRGQQEVLAELPLRAHTPVRRRWLEREVSEAFTATAGNQRMRRAMEALLLPTTSVVLPSAQLSGVPEVRWVFCLPVRITFSAEQLGKATVLHGGFVPVEGLVNSLEQTGVTSDTAILGGYSSLYRREDLFAYGPLALAQSFVDADESEDFDIPPPLPIMLDSGLPASNTVTCLILMVAQMPLGENRLFNSRMLKKETRQIVEAGVLERLRNNGISAESVVVDQLTLLHELYLHSVTGPMTRELEAHLENIKQTFGDAVQVKGNVPAPGYLELNVIDELGDEHEGVAAFSVLEPAPVLTVVLQKLCSKMGVGFSAVGTSATIQLSPQLH